MRATTLLERFMEKVSPEPNTGCWLWTGAVDARGYGKVASGGRGGRTLQAHRVALSLLAGVTLGDDECALHHCDNPACVNPGPGHLFVGTRRDNSRDMVAKGRNAWARHPHLRARAFAAALVANTSPRN